MRKKRGRNLNMKYLARVILVVLLTFSIFLIETSSILRAESGKVADQTQNNTIDPKLLQNIDDFIDMALESSEIPGLSLTLVMDQSVYQKGYGYANEEKREAVTSKTLFELASNSKAFTGLAILKLEKEGFLQLDDDITQYVPWLKMKYNGQIAHVTIEQVAQHMSGIPYKSITKIPVSSSEDALLKTVQTLIGVELSNPPGRQFEYATINYDVLGLIIQNVTGVPYEEYIREHILIPLGMNNTYLFREEAGHDLAQGYKMNFFKPSAYQAPFYRGNTPAGNIISGGTDMENWLKYQLGMKEHDELSAIIEQSHPDSNKMYSFGWGFGITNDFEQQFTHAGTNPNFSSMIVLRPYEQIGIAVLANMNSEYTISITYGVADILEGKQPQLIQSDQYKELDSIASIIVFIIIPILAVLLYILGRTIRQLYRKERSRIKLGAKAVLLISLSVLLVGIFMFILSYWIRVSFLQGLPFHFIRVWAPASIMIMMYLLSLFVLMIYVYVMLLWLYPKRNKTH